MKGLLYIGLILTLLIVALLIVKQNEMESQRAKQAVSAIGGDPNQVKSLQQLPNAVRGRLNKQMKLLEDRNRKYLEDQGGK